MYHVCVQTVESFPVDEILDHVENGMLVQSDIHFGLFPEVKDYFIFAVKERVMMHMHAA